LISNIFSEASINLIPSWSKANKSLINVNRLPYLLECFGFISSILGSGIVFYDCRCYDPQILPIINIKTKL
jgi:hypothetical protein